MSSNKKGNMKLFHHTDKESAKKIIESGEILKSDPSKGDAVYGPGTYLTSKGPEYSKDDIAQNNYDGTTAKFWEDKVQAGKADVAIEKTLPRSSVTKCSGVRDVYKVEGNLKLDKNTKIHVRDQSTRGYSTYVYQ